MSDGLFLIDKDNVPKRMEARAFEFEDAFQALLEKFPELLTDADFGEGAPRRWMLVKREAGVPAKEFGSDRWSLDHLFLDQDGVPTLIEVKRVSDPRARREVVAQMLDYAANAVNLWEVAKLKNWFLSGCDSEKPGPTRLGELLGTETPDEGSFWRSVQANLESGRIRMIFVADRIAPELETIVEFLNKQMNPATVVALELAQFSNGAERILAPRLIGMTSQKRRIGPAAQSVEEWLVDVAAPETFETSRRFIELMTSLGAKPRIAGGSVAFDFAAPGVSARFAYIRQNGKLALSCYMLRKTEPFRSESQDGN